MAEPPGQGPLYQVHASAIIRQTLRELQRRAARQGRGDEPPIRGHSAQAVDEHERRSASADEVAAAAGAPLLEGAPIGFGLRRHQGIFFR